MHCEWNSACKSRQFVQHSVGSSWDLPAPTLKLLIRDFTQLLGEEDLVQAPLPRCAVFVDRHVYKNGGSTMREIMLENSMRDGWAYSGCGPQQLEPI